MKAVVVAVLASGLVLVGCSSTSSQGPSVAVPTDRDGTPDPLGLEGPIVIDTTVPLAGRYQQLAGLCGDTIVHLRAEVKVARAKVASSPSESEVVNYALQAPLGNQETPSECASNITDGVSAG